MRQDPITNINNMLSIVIGSTKRNLSSLRNPCFQPLRKVTSSQQSTIPSWATVDPQSLGSDPNPHNVLNIVAGKWQSQDKIKGKIYIPNPMDEDAPHLCTVPDTSIGELGPFIKSMESVSKSGVHNPLKNVERYLMYGDISRKVRGNKEETYLVSFLPFVFTLSFAYRMRCV